VEKLMPIYNQLTSTNADDADTNLWGYARIVKTHKTLGLLHAAAVAIVLGLGESLLG
jgi:hypothetical protein